MTIDTKKLKGISPELAKLKVAIDKIKEAWADSQKRVGLPIDEIVFYVRYYKDRDLDDIPKHFEEGVIISQEGINIINTIAQTVLAQQAKIEELEEKVRKLESIPVKVRKISDLEFEPMPDEHEDIIGEAARQGERDAE